MREYSHEFPDGDGFDYPERPPLARRRPPSSAPRRHAGAEVSHEPPASKAKGAAGKGKQKKGGHSFGSGYTQNPTWTGRQWAEFEKGKGKGGI